MLLARSDMFPALAKDILNGLKLAFKNAGPQFSPKLFIESIGNGTDDEVLQRVEKLLLQEDVDVVVGFCSFFMLDRLAAIATSYKKPIVHVSLGARSLKAMHVNPYMLYQSLNLTHSSYLSGKIAVETIGKKAAILASFYDGGYHMAEAFVRGFVDNGGEIIYNYVSQMDYRQDDFGSMIEGIQNTQPDVLFALFSYKEAERVLEVMAASGLDHLKMLTIPTMVDEGTKVGQVNPDQIISIASWAFDESAAAMEAFKKDYEENHAEKPNIMGLLGNEVGIVLTDALKRDGKLPEKIGAYMASMTIQSPRGELQYTEHNESVPNAFKVRQLSARDGVCHNAVIAQIDAAGAEDIYEKMGEIPNTGWKNPYICT